jgi:hypothetical protein
LKEAKEAGSLLGVRRFRMRKNAVAYFSSRKRSG